MSGDSDCFIRAVNLRLDVGNPELFNHYYPTSKSANVIRAIVEGNPDIASIVVASYGSGKSLAAGTAALIIENNSKARKTLRQIAERIQSVDRTLGMNAMKRAKSRAKGLPILLEGYEASLTETLLNSAKDNLKRSRVKLTNKQSKFAALDAIADCARKQKLTVSP